MQSDRTRGTRKVVVLLGSEVYLEGLLHGAEDGAGELFVGVVTAHIGGADLAARGLVCG